MSILHVFIFGAVNFNCSIILEIVVWFTFPEFSMRSYNWHASNEDLNIFLMILNEPSVSATMYLNVNVTSTNCVCTWCEWSSLNVILIY